MKSLVLSTVFALGIVGQSPLAAAAPTGVTKWVTATTEAVNAASKQLGRAHGAMFANTLRLMRMNPLIAMNPLMPTAQQAEKVVMVRASYLQGTALRAFMIGATPLGVTRQAKSSYLAGVGEALKTP